LRPKCQNGRADWFQKKAEDAVSMAKSQPDIGKEEQNPQGQLDKLESQQPSQDDGCPECRIKMARINDLEMELKNQEEKAKQHEEAACMHEWHLANAHVDEVRKELSNRINELEGQQSGQISTSESATSQPRPTHYYCDDCLYLQMELREARQKSRDLDDKLRYRKQRIRGLEYQVNKAQEEGSVLRQDLDEANREISRLRAELGIRTSKL
jgi:chromosome segregation ATPase